MGSEFNDRGGASHPGDDRPTPTVSADARLEALTAELARVSADQSGFLTLIVGFVSSALLAAGGFFALQRQDPTNPPADWWWGLVLLIPLLMAAFAIIQTGKTVTRQYYGRSLEREILDQTDPGWRSGTHLPVGALFDSINASYEGNKRGERSVRAVVTILYIVISAVLGWATLYALMNMGNWRYRVVFGCAYAAIVLPSIVASWQAFFRGREMWRRVEARTATEVRRPLVEPRQRSIRRSLGSYLLMPRPNDFIVKALFLHLLATIFGALLLYVHDSDAFRLNHAVRSGLALIFAFEYLVYQARYMVNDWTGRRSDSLHSKVEERGRAPDLSTSPRRRIFLIGGVARALLGIAVPFLLLSWERATLVAGLSGVAYLLAVVYERLRRRAILSARESPALLLRSIPVFVAVGVSYGLRASAGLWFGTDGRIPTGPTVGVAVAFYLVGVMSVLMAWALEGATGVAWKHNAEMTAPTLLVQPALREKSHVVALATVVKPNKALTWGVEFDPSVPDDDQAFLKNDGRLQTPWNLAAVAAIGAAAAAGTSLYEWPASFGWPLVAGSLVGIAFGLAIVRVGQIAIGMLAFVGPAVVLSYGAEGLFGLVPALLAALTYLQIRPLEYRYTISFFGKLRSDIRTLHLLLRDLVRELRT